MAAINAASLEPSSGHRKTKAAAPLAENGLSRYIGGVNHLTRQEIFVICIVLGLLVTGRCVKAYRSAHPAAASVQTARP
jgi:hypothetical protein